MFYEFSSFTILNADKSSLQTGKNDHINGTAKCRRSNLKLLLNENTNLMQQS
jgi:hypothetical protein